MSTENVQENTQVEPLGIFSDQENNLCKDLESMRHNLLRNQDAFEKKADAFWEGLSEEDREYAVMALTKILHEHLMEGGSYRTLIYQRMGFSTKMYGILQLAGLLDLHNCISGELSVPVKTPEDLRDLCQSLNDMADRVPKEPLKTEDGSPLLNRDGCEILMPGPEAKVLSLAIMTLSQAYGAVTRMRVLLENTKLELFEAREKLRQYSSISETDFQGAD
jgi:hypothetical protein